ncbi:hypothetical protein MUO14_13175 [Halobacillus shinanisalinarum]|uniref:Uncharacterized protein n=1 Tax=Halobacillus shinanisalinarum TaxID=2932258 RepID=A0ABY4GUF9_9BACI|nr:hypothetical protein [Halobacillus shinanisalinarum]UOQ91533.1 hypothetical protein MUO14_13175 [Halobacillus shinanisalinarum]
MINLTKMRIVLSILIIVYFLIRLPFARTIDLHPFIGLEMNTAIIIIIPLLDLIVTLYIYLQSKESRTESNN